MHPDMMTDVQVPMNRRQRRKARSIQRRITNKILSRRASSNWAKAAKAARLLREETA